MGGGDDRAPVLWPEVRGLAASECGHGEQGSGPRGTWRSGLPFPLLRRLRDLRREQLGASIGAFIFPECPQTWKHAGQGCHFKLSQHPPPKKNSTHLFSA